MRSRILIAGLLITATASVFAQKSPARPKITGVSHLAIYTSNAAATEHYYAVSLGAAKMADPENPEGVKYAFSPTQWVEVLPLPANAGINRMDHAALTTDSAEGMRKYLKAHSWKVPAAVTKGADGSQWFTVHDPEGNKIEFVQPAAGAKVDAPNAIGHHLIHVGFLVHNRDREDTFYKGLLGFKPYWYGGMKDDKVDWVSAQVPDGHDWLEYMVQGDNSFGIPPKMSQQNLGVLNHIAIGEKSVEEAFKTLKDNGRLEGVKNDNATKVGRDGKVQLNMYDPDGTRAELMSLHAVEKPCCSEFTAPDPSE